MKVKGINPIEQHVEKIVLALVALVLLGVLSLQFLTQPNQVDVGNRQVPPQSVFVELERQAEVLDSQLKNPSPPLPDVKQTDLVVRYDRAFAQASGSAGRLSAALGTGVNISASTGTDITAAGPSSDKVAVLAVPKTSAVIAASQWGTLDPYALLAVPEYARFVPAQQPFDLPSVTIESTFSGTALREALAPASGVGVPRRFWSATGMAIMGFEVERQELRADGSWSSPAPIVTPPGTPTPTRAITPEAGLPELTELISKAAGVAPEVQRPMGPPIIAGPEWTPPSERVVSEGSTELTEGDRVRRTLERAVAELERLQNAQNAPGTQRSDPAGGRGPMRSTDPVRNPTGPTDRAQRRMEQLQTQIQELREQLRTLGEPDPTAGAAPFGNPRDPGGRPMPQDSRSAPGFSPGAMRPGSLELLEQEKVQLWAHDLGVKPGATYRYRTRVVLNNPLFRKGPVLDTQDEALQAASKDPFVRGEWSGWTEPVVVGATEYYFVTAADAESAINAGRATASIDTFRMYYGHYRKSTLNLNPGDPVATSVRIPDGLFLIDTGVIDAKTAGEAMFAETPGSLPAGLTKASGRLSVDLGAYVLDVAALPIQGQDAMGRAYTVTEVLLRDASGRVVVRTGRADTGGQAFILANGSSSAASKTPLREPGQPTSSPASELFVPTNAQP